MQLYFQKISAIRKNNFVFFKNNNMFEQMNKFSLLDHDSKIPLHMQAEQRLRKLIKENKLKDGDSFPKETDLARRWSISRNTLRQAISKLVYEGLLERKKRLGTTVKKKKITTDLGNWFSFTHEMEDKGTPFKDLKNIVSIVKCNNETGKRLQIDSGKQVVCLKRVRSTSNKPMVYFKSFFHPRIGLTGNENFKQPLYEMLDEQFHVVPVYSQEEIKAIAANEKIARMLNIEKGSAVLERKRVVLDAGRKPIEYNICYYRSDCFTYSIEIKR